MSRQRTVGDLLQIFAGFERRALELYRHFAQEFARHAAAGRIWRAMSDAEAGHFAILRLAEDRLPAGATAQETALSFDEGTLDEWEATLEELDAQSRRPGLALADAAAVTLTWEREELPRLLALLTALPEPARRTTAAGLVQGAEEHLRCLEELLRAVGSESLLPEVSRLEESVARLRLLAAG
ncbi:MAG: hypothetical protein ACREJ6_15055 [Candidatus Methylomirabilis sp.]